MRLTVLYFGAARERAGVSREELELPSGVRVAQLLERLAGAHPGLGPLLPHLKVALDQELVLGDAELTFGAEVAIIPPVAGGAGLFRVQEAPLQLAEVVAAVSGPEQGGVVTFSGAVRGNSRGRTVLQLSYEAYIPMAEKVLATIAVQAQQHWAGVRLAILHRVGVLRPGELAVVIAASAPHRKEAFEACAFAIERLKQDAPIWKKEQYTDGEAWVGLGP